MSEFKMPSLGADMEAGTLVEWMKQPGDPVQRGEVIAAVETQKGAIEIEVFESGVLERILVQVGERVPVGTPLAFIRSDAEGEAVLAEPEASPALQSAVPAAVASPPTPPSTPAVGPPAVAPPPHTPLPSPAPAETRPGPRVSPVAMRRALELGLDLSRVPPGADGVIGLREIEAAIAKAMPSVPTPAAPMAPPAVAPAAGSALPPPAPVTHGGIDLEEMRKAIASAMSRSWREIPHFFVSSVIDVSPMLAWLQRENARRQVPDRLHYSVPLIKAVAMALKATPAMNGHFENNVFQPSSAVHLGIAVAMRGGGLIAPALLDADGLDLQTLMVRLDDLVARVRGGRLRSSELSAATATLSNLGEGTADMLQPVIYPPQVAIIGCGRIAEHAWAHGNALSARQTLTVTVGGDHRVSDGRSASALLRRLEELLQQPENL